MTSNPLPTPLQPTRYLPSPQSSPVSRHHKRAHDSPSSTQKRAKLVSVSHTNQDPLGAPSTPTVSGSLPVTIRGPPALTPFDKFKIPDLPRSVRMMTPSTSTVAASSSPTRHVESSSPIRPTNSRSPLRVTAAASAVQQTVQLRRDVLLVIGRHRHGIPTPTISSTSSSRSAESVIPSRFHSNLSDLSQATEQIALPRTAAHASRIHCAIEYRSVEKVFRVVVMGQNGIRLRVGSGKLRRVRVGEFRDVRESGGSVEVDFYGHNLRLNLPQMGPVDAERLVTPESSPILAMNRDLPPSSPPVMAEDAEREASDAESSLSDFDAEGEDVEMSAESIQGEASLAVKQEIMASTPVPAAQSRAASEEKEKVPLPEGVDLAALLAMTVVFSGSSKLSLPDLVKHMLESQPSLREHGEEPQWMEWAKDELEGNEMFGKVQRHGKLMIQDSSGQPLLPHYFYSPEADLDANRAKELGGLVRPLRAAQRAGGKAIDWRPVGGGRRR